MEDQKCRGGKWRTGKCGTENAGPEIAGLENVRPGIQIHIPHLRTCNRHQL